MPRPLDLTALLTDLEVMIRIADRLAGSLRAVRRAVELDRTMSVPEENECGNPGCLKLLPLHRTSRRKFCSNRCRVAASRIREREAIDARV